MADRFVFRPGTRVSGVKPEVVASEMERIRDKHGSLRSETIVEEARPSRAPLHPAFEWDDAKAGEKFRLMQARTLVRAIMVVRDKEAPRSVYAFVPSVSEKAGDYGRLDEVAEQVDRFTLALESSLRSLHSAQERVNELKRAAEDQPDDKVSAIVIASQALRAAERAIRTLH